MNGDDVELYWDVITLSENEQVFRLKQTPRIEVRYHNSMVYMPEWGVTAFAFFALSKYIREKYLPESSKSD